MPFIYIYFIFFSKFVSFIVSFLSSTERERKEVGKIGPFIFVHAREVGAQLYQSVWGSSFLSLYLSLVWVVGLEFCRIQLFFILAIKFCVTCVPSLMFSLLSFHFVVNGSLVADSDYFLSLFILGSSLIYIYMRFECFDMFPCSCMGGVCVYSF